MPEEVKKNGVLESGELLDCFECLGLEFRDFWESFLAFLWFWGALEALRAHHVLLAGAA